MQKSRSQLTLTPTSFPTPQSNGPLSNRRNFQKFLMPRLHAGKHSLDQFNSVASKLAARRPKFQKNINSRSSKKSSLSRHPTPPPALSSRNQRMIVPSISLPWKPTHPQSASSFASARGTKDFSPRFPASSSRSNLHQSEKPPPKTPDLKIA